MEKLSQCASYRPMTDGRYTETAIAALLAAVTRTGIKTRFAPSVLFGDGTEDAGGFFTARTGFG